MVDDYFTPDERTRLVRRLPEGIASGDAIEVVDEPLTEDELVALWGQVDTFGPLRHPRLSEEPVGRVGSS
jgi:hypothetical protein